MLSFSPEYGPKLKEESVMVKHLPKIKKDDDSRKCCLSDCFNCCNDNWQKVMNYSIEDSLISVSLSLSLSLSLSTSIKPFSIVYTIG
jgi:hypothetical protein